MVLEALRFSREKKSLEVLDQLKVPQEKVYIPVRSAQEAYDVVKSMQVRGAPLLAMVSALGLAVEVLREPMARGKLLERMDFLKTSRPTAVNLRNAMEQLRQVVLQAQGDCCEAYVHAAERMLREDVEANEAIGDQGADAIVAAMRAKGRQGGARVITICNTGALATAGWGTALGVLRTLHARGKLEMAYCLETRPYNQGSRLTAWLEQHDASREPIKPLPRFELVEDGLPGTLICDSMAGALMQKGVDACVATLIRL